MLVRNPNQARKQLRKSKIPRERQSPRYHRPPPKMIILIPRRTGAEPGEIITFGTYPQTADGGRRGQNADIHHELMK